MDTAASPPLAAVSERIAEIIYALCQTLTTRLRAATVTQAELTYIVARLLGIRKRFRCLAARISAGRPPRERARRPREAAPEPEFPLGFRPPPPGWRRWAVRADNPVPTWRSLRQNRFAWLLPLAPNVPGFRDSAAGLRARLLDLLAEPETRALLMASRRVGDSLRPLCWMLGIENSVLYPARPAMAAVALAPGSLAPASGCADAAADAHSPRDKNEVSAVATPGRIAPGVMEARPARPRAQEGGDFFTTG